MFHAVFQCTPANWRSRRPGRTCTKNGHPASISAINRKPDDKDVTSAKQGPVFISSILHSMSNQCRTRLGRAGARVATPGVWGARAVLRRGKEAPTPLGEMVDRPRLGHLLTTRCGSDPEVRAAYSDLGRRSPLGGASDVRGVGVHIVPEFAESWISGGKRRKRMGMSCRNIVVGPSANLP